VLKQYTTMKQPVHTQRSIKSKSYMFQLYEMAIIGFITQKYKRKSHSRSHTFNSKSLQFRYWPYM